MVGSIMVAVSALKPGAQYSAPLPYKPVTIQKVHGVSEFKGAFIDRTPGRPQMPWYMVSFLLPPDADITSVTARIINPVAKELSGPYTINPGRALRHENGRDIWPKGSIIMAGKDVGIYRKNAFFPSDYIGAVTCGKMRQYNIVDVRINPYLYNPISKKLRMIMGGSLSISFKTKSRPESRHFPRADWAENLLRAKTVNSAHFDIYGPARSTGSLHSGIGYLIISPSKFWKSSPGLNAYHEYLASQGVSVSKIDESVFNPNGAMGQALTDNIRNAIINWMNTVESMGVEAKYVLLIGNPDTSRGDVPMKNWMSNGTGIPTDFYYADLSGDWNNSGTDNHAELCVGRIPVYDDEGGLANLDAYLAKAIAYEKAEKSGSGIEWRRTVMTPAVPVDNFPESYQLGETISSIFTPKGWSVYRIYDPYAGTEGFDLVPEVVNMVPLPERVNGSDMIKTWNCVTPGLVVWYTHGSPHLAAGLINSYSTIADPAYHTVTQLKNDFPAMVFAASCCNADPQAYDNLGYQMLCNNAIGFVGATVEIFSPDAPAQLFAQYLANNVTSGSIGDALNAAKSLEGDKDHSCMLNLYGCPEVSLGLDSLAGRLQIPRNVTAHAAPWGSPILLTWSAVQGATSYCIERGANNGRGFDRIGTVTGSSTSYSDSRVDYCVLYKYRLCARNDEGGWSGYSATDSASTYDQGKGAVPPQAPSGLAAAAGSNSAFLTWSGTPHATSYNVRRSFLTNKQNFVTIANTETPAFLDSNLINGNIYYYSVSAVNGFGQGPGSAVISVGPKINLVAPNLIGVSSITEPGNNLIPTSVGCSWNTLQNNELGFAIEYAHKFPDGSYGPFTGLDQVDRRSAWARIDYMEGNTGFAFRMCAFSDTDHSPYSNVVEFSTSAYDPPSAPTGLWAREDSPEILTVHWHYSASKPIPVNFQIFYRQTGGVWSYGVDLPYLDTPFTFQIIPSSKYQIYVRAAESDTDAVHNVTYRYSSFSNELEVCTSPVLAAPVMLFASPYSWEWTLLLGGIALSWMDNSLDQSILFNVERSERQGGPFCKIASVSSDQYTDTGLANGKQYWYRVRAYAGRVSSGPSNSIAGTTPGNIASGKISFASSYRNSNPPKNGNDDNAATYWCAASAALPQWWEVDLGDSMDLAGSEVVWKLSGQSKTYRYKIETSTDNASWITVADLTGNKSRALTQKQEFNVRLGTTGRYVRITITGVPVGASASFSEFRVFGEQESNTDFANLLPAAYYSRYLP